MCKTVKLHFWSIHGSTEMDILCMWHGNCPFICYSQELASTAYILVVMINWLVGWLVDGKHS